MALFFTQYFFFLVLTVVAQKSESRDQRNHPTDMLPLETFSKVLSKGHFKRLSW
jgi:hypothetical protein